MRHFRVFPPHSLPLFQAVQHFFLSFYFLFFALLSFFLSFSCVSLFQSTRLLLHVLTRSFLLCLVPLARKQEDGSDSPRMRKAKETPPPPVFAASG